MPSLVRRTKRATSTWTQRNTQQTVQEEQEQSPPPSPSNDEGPSETTSWTNNQPRTVKLSKPDKDGWFTNAPKDDTHRKQCRRKAWKSAQQEGEEFHAAAVTEEVSLPQAKPRPTSARSRGPDFKKFRKNVIPLRHSEGVSLRSVQPKESEQQRELAEQQREVEEEERRADELFHGETAAPTRKRRRR